LLGYLASAPKSPTISHYPLLATDGGDAPCDQSGFYGWVGPIWPKKCSRQQPHGRVASGEPSRLAAVRSSKKVAGVQKRRF